MKGMRRLVAIPSDPIRAHEDKGRGGLLRDYFNPTGFFDEVYVLAPWEEPGERRAHGLVIRRVDEARMRAALKGLRPDLVRAYGAEWAADLAARARLPDVPLIVSVHDKRPDKVRRSVRYADAVFCLSEAAAAPVRARGVEEARIRILPNRVDTDRFRPGAMPGTREALSQRFPAGRYILHVGRRAREKNLETVLAALARLPSDYCAVFVGRGDPAPYQREAARLGVADRTVWIDMVENSDLPGWYAWCDCLCVPTRTEAFGTVFLEAAACGTPVVTTDAPPMNTYLAHEQSALLVPDPEDGPSLAAAIRRASEDEELRAQLARGAVAAAQPFAKARIDALEAQLLREALHAPRPGRLRRAERCLWAASTSRTARRLRHPLRTLRAAVHHLTR